MQAKTERIPIMFDKELVEKVDEFGFQNKIRTRAEAVRSLVRAGLERKAETKNGTEAAA